MLAGINASEKRAFLWAQFQHAGGALITQVEIPTMLIPKEMEMLFQNKFSEFLNFKEWDGS